MPYYQTSHVIFFPADMVCFLYPIQNILQVFRPSKSRKFSLATFAVKKACSILVFFIYLIISFDSNETISVIYF